MDRLKEFPQPWSPSARESLEQGKLALVGLVDTHARRRLAEEFIRYARGDISGRAFLVGGYRGAGKTTAVLAAMQHVYNECVQSNESGSKLARCRPLLVRLHGPSLLIDSPRGEPNASNGTANAKDSAAPPPTAEDRTLVHTRRFLEEMAAGIFPALIDEVRRQMQQSTPVDKSPGTSRRRQRFLEMTAHVCDALSQGMSLDELREMFRRLGFLESHAIGKAEISGVLGKTDVFQELVAIKEASEAYLIVTGNFETKNSDGRNASNAEDEKTAYTLDGDKLVKGLTPIAAAVAAAVGIASTHVWEALIVSAGILVSGLSFTRTLARSRSRTAAHTRSFTRDNTHESLMRRVPLLVETLRQVGFPPIFVLDELDKLNVPSAETLLDRLMRNIKSYVTERSFICFMVERSYYELINSKIAGRVGERYGVEHTYYSDSAYVVSTPDAYHQYIRSVTREDEILADAKTEIEQSRKASQQFWQACLRHVILHRARMHAYDVRRELRRVAEDEGELHSVTRSGFRLPAKWTYRALMQLCIEWILSDAVLRSAAAEDPFTSQIQQDYLYDVSNAWLATVDLQTLDPANPDPSLVAARRRMLAYLKEPGALLRDIHEELDLERLELFFKGEQKVEETERQNARAELAKRGSAAGRDPARLAACFATRKYRVLLFVTRPQVRPVLDAAGETWNVSPRGYSVGEESLDQGDQARIDALKDLRNRFDELIQLDDVKFGTLWNIGDPSFPIEQLDAALARLDAVGHSQEDIVTVGRFAAVVPVGCHLVLVLVVGLYVLRTIRQAGPSHDVREDHDYSMSNTLGLLRGGIQGTSIETCTVSAAGLVDNVAREHGIGLPSEAATLLKAAQDGAFHEDILQTDLERLHARMASLTPPQFDDRAVRGRWYDSLAERIYASLEDQTLEPALEEAGRRLDVVALLNGWPPPALGSIWPTWLQPKAWTIVVYSELLADAPDSEGVEGTPQWLRALAAAQLGQREYLETLLSEPATSVPSPPVTKILQWVQRRLRSLPSDPRRVLLINPGAVMTSWLPVPAEGAAGVSALSVRGDTASSDFIKRYDIASFDFVINEVESPRPPELARNQYVVVAAAVPSSRAADLSWRRMPDDTLVLLGPPSLPAAIQWMFDAFAR